MAKEVLNGANNCGITGVVLGVVAIASFMYTPLAAIVLSITGLIFSIVQGRKGKNSWSKAGVILNIIAIVLIIISLTILAYLVSTGALAGSNLAQAGA